MSYRPGVSVTTQTVPTPRSVQTDTGVAFMVGLMDQGPTNVEKPVRSMPEVIRTFGARQAYASNLYDALDVFFHEGGALAHVGRVVGSSAVIASTALLDGAAATSLTVKAKGPGAGTTPTGPNFIKVQVLAGINSGYRLRILDANNVVLETTPDLTTQQDAVNWSTFSQYVNVTLGSSALVPVVAAAATLTGGADDRGSIADANWLNALNLFGADLGPGQVSAPGRTTDAGHLQLGAHALANNRVALYDLPDTATAATLLASAAAARANGEKGYAVTPWVQAPGLVAGLVRTVAPSSFISALIARNDPAWGVDQASAGETLGEAIWVTGLSQTAFDNDPATRQTLNDGSVNVLRNYLGGVRNYGWRSIVDPVATPDWEDFGNVRLAMAIEAEAKRIAEQFMFRQLDGAGTTIGHFQAQLIAMLDRFYRDGALYGASPADAYFVDVGPAVNTAVTIANNELHAVLNVKMSPMAEWIQITVVKVPITGVV